MLPVYLLLCYGVATFLMIATYSEEGKLTVKDLLMLALAPFSIVPVVFIHLISHFVELDTVVVRK